LSQDVGVRRQLRLSWGVEPLPLRGLSGTDELFVVVREVARSRGAQAGENVVVTAGLPLNVPGTTNLLHVLAV
jgi:pyruvate kinase